MRYLGAERYTGWTVWLSTVRSLPAAERLVNWPSPRFVLLVAADFVRERNLARFARHILNAGCVGFSAWGPNCEAAHDAVDRQIRQLRIGRSVGATVLTTWHSSDPIEDAVLAVMAVNHPDDYFADGCESILIVNALGKSVERQLVAAAKTHVGQHVL